MGQTTKSFKERFNQHKSEKRNRHVSNAIRFYGEDNFERTILISTLNQDDLNYLEVYFVEYYNCMHPNGYNHRCGGDQNGICSDELKRKISESKMGKPNFKKRGELRSKEYREKISKGLGGKPIIARNIITGEQIIFNTVQESKLLGFNPSNIVSILKKRDGRTQSKGYTFEYANQSGSTESKNSGHAQRIEIEPVKSE